MRSGGLRGLQTRKRAGESRLGWVRFPHASAKKRLEGYKDISLSYERCQFARRGAAENVRLQLKFDLLPTLALRLEVSCGSEISCGSAARCAVSL